MMTQNEDAANLFDRIRADADEKRQARLEEEKKNDEYFARIKSGNNPLDEINRLLKGENK